jgi:predicted nucleic acid-binding protein
MNAVDTNVLVYRFDRLEPVKRAKAKALLTRLASTTTPALLLWQVAGELKQQLRRWEDQNVVSRRNAKRYFQAIRGSLKLHLPTPNVLDRADDLRDHYSLSHWDSMLLAACLEAGVTTLFTEDMGAPRKIDAIQLENPFA